MLHLPIANADVNAWALLLIGFCVGVLGGFFGIGGAFIVTPTLNILGFPMAFAIGTDIAHIFGKSIVASYKHALLRHVDFKLGLIMGVLSMSGLSLGKQAVLYLEKNRPGRAHSADSIHHPAFFSGPVYDLGI